ncbi:MAG TPA: phosphomannomutase/phosphoglucomutase, partial [Alcanivorax sp.]|nr:phosphomannomutase/phosphoglucomutase [Alcanivorax sp.]
SRPMKVVVDCGNGAAAVAAPEALMLMGCDVVPLFLDVDGRFPNHAPDPADPDTLH